MSGKAAHDGGRGPEMSDKGDREFHMLENNPEVMTALAHKIGLSEKLAFHDVYSVYDADMLAFIPRPVHALVATIPLTPAWEKDREAEDGPLPWYPGAGADEPVTWFRQTIPHGCGLIALIHSLCNGEPLNMIAPGSILAKFLEKATPLGMAERADALKASDELYESSESVAGQGDSIPLTLNAATGNHFLALVKGDDGHLWELEGARKGPLDRGALGKDDDLLSDRALDLGIRRLVDIQKEGGGTVRFSCIALGPNMD